MTERNKERLRVVTAGLWGVNLGVAVNRWSAGENAIPFLVLALAFLSFTIVRWGDKA